MEFKATEQNWGDFYKERYEIYDNFCKKLRGLLEELLNINHLDFAQIDSRTKEINSFIDKIKRKKYINPLEEITDLVGLRIITYYRDDINKIGDIIEKEFNIDWKNSVGKFRELEDDRFGYASKHYIINILPLRSELAEWKQFNNLKAEIQIRTVLEHAWAAVSHRITYKNEQVKSKFLRQFSRLSALLELADEQFLNLRKESKQIEQPDLTLDKLVGLTLDKKIEFPSLRDYLNYTNINRKLLEMAENCGFRKYKPLKLIYEKHILNEQCNILIDIIKHTEIENLGQLNILLTDALTYGEKILKDILGISREDENMDKNMLFLTRQPYWVIMLFIILRYKSEFIPEFESLQIHRSLKNVISKAFDL